MFTIIYRNIKYAEGFTLIEVIVVAVIVAVLATVAIPLYSSYVESEKKSTAENCADSFASFVSTGLTLGAIDKGIGSITYDGNGTNNTLESRTSNPDFQEQFIIPSGVTCTLNWDNGYVRCANGNNSSKEYKFKIKKTRTENLITQDQKNP